MFESVFTICRRTLGRETWGRVRAAMDAGLSIETFPDALDTLTAEMDLPGFLADLARLEWALHQKKIADTDPAQPVAAIAVNPTFTLLALSWKNLAMMVGTKDTGSVPLNEPALESFEVADIFTLQWHVTLACDLNLVCRGCLAIAYSLGLDIFEEKDPFCFDTRAPLTG